MVEEARTDGKSTRFETFSSWFSTIKICKAFFEHNLHRFGTAFNSEVALDKKRLGIGVMNGFIGGWVGVLLFFFIKNMENYTIWKSYFEGEKASKRIKRWLWFQLRRSIGNLQHLPQVTTPINSINIFRTRSGIWGIDTNATLWSETRLTTTSFIGRTPATKAVHLSLTASKKT